MFFLMVMVCNALVGQSYQLTDRLYTGTMDAELGTKFGWCIASNGNDLAVGAPHYEGQDGRVSVFVASGGNIDPTPVHFRDALAVDGDARPLRFGASMAMDNDRLVVGQCSAYGNSQYCQDEQSGRVTVFIPSDGSWQAHTRIQGIWGGTFGKALALAGDVLAVGGARDTVNGVQRDVVFIYRYENELWSLQPVDTLYGTDQLNADDGFGHAMAISGDLLLVGASSDNELAMDGGAAYLFRRDPNDQWNLIRKLMPSNGMAGDRFGTAVALDPMSCLVGAPRHSADDEIVGAAYLFGRDFGFSGNWGEAEALGPIGGATGGMEFGASVAIQPEALAVGAPLHALSTPGTDGSVHVFSRSDGEVLPIERITPYWDGIVSPVSRAGTSLAFVGEDLLIGAPFAKLEGLEPSATSPHGAVLVYSPLEVGVPEQALSIAHTWPNPFTDVLQFDCPTCATSAVVLMDTQGREVGRMSYVANTIASWSLGELAPGSYYIRATARDRGLPVNIPVVHQ